MNNTYINHKKSKLFTVTHKIPYFIGILFITLLLFSSVSFLYLNITNENGIGKEKLIQENTNTLRKPMAADTTDNIVALWSFENTSLIGYDYHQGTETGSVSFVSGYYGDGLSFTGGDSGDSAYYTDHDDLDIASPMSWGGWIKPNEYASMSEPGAIMWKEQEYGMRVEQTGTQRVSVCVYDSDNSEYKYAYADEVPANTWQHVMGVWNGSDLQIYINGTLKDTTAVAGTVSATSNDLRFGDEGSNSWEYAGDLDDVRIYNTALGMWDIKTIMFQEFYYAQLVKDPEFKEEKSNSAEFTEYTTYGNWTGDAGPDDSGSEDKDYWYYSYDNTNMELWLKNDGWFIEDYGKVNISQKLPQSYLVKQINPTVRVDIVSDSYDCDDGQTEFELFSIYSSTKNTYLSHTGTISGSNNFFVYFNLNGIQNLNTSSQLLTGVNGILDNNGGGNNLNWKIDSIKAHALYMEKLDSDRDGIPDEKETNDYNTQPENEDTDGDQIPDTVEIFMYGTDPNDNDTDGDGLTDGWEIINNLDPKNNDTDGDGMPDGWEIQYNTLMDPTDGTDKFSDFDSDGVKNYWEYKNGTSPVSADTDSDDMPDDWEIQYKSEMDPTDGGDKFGDPDGDNVENYWEYMNGTSPVSADTDSDDMPDGWEIQYKSEMDPTDGGDKFGDPDGDNVENYWEYMNGTSPVSADSDSDDMPDGWELNYTSILDPTDGSDNTNDDDNDQLQNYEEFTLGTDPTVADTDGDGYFDGVEISSNTDPTDPNDYPTSINGGTDGDDDGDSSNNGGSTNDGDNNSEGSNEDSGGNTIIFVIIGGVGAVAVGGIGVYMKKKDSGDEYATKEDKFFDDFEQAEGGELKGSPMRKSQKESEISENIEEEDFEDDGLKWEDASIRSSYSPEPAYTNSTQGKDLNEETDVAKSEDGRMAKKATESAPEEASLTDEDILSDLEGEMREIYKNGREFLEMGQESMAIKSFEILSTKAEKLGKENLVKFIESKIDNIY